MTVKKEQLDANSKSKTILNTPIDSDIGRLISETDMLLELKVLINDFYIATVTVDKKELKLTFQNGQKFKIFVEACV